MGGRVAYLNSERAEQDHNVRVDVFVLTPEDRVLRHSEDMVLVRTRVTVARDGVVSHEPLGARLYPGKLISSRGNAH